MNIRPLHDRVVIRRVEEEQKNRWRHRATGVMRRKNPRVVKFWPLVMAVFWITATYVHWM